MKEVELKEEKAGSSETSMLETGVSDQSFSTDAAKRKENYEALTKAVQKHLLYPRLCLQDLEEIVFEDVLGYKIRKDTNLSEEGTSTSQEVAVLTPKILALWFSEETSGGAAEGEVAMHTQTRFVPVREFTAVSLTSHYGRSENGEEIRKVNAIVTLNNLKSIKKEDGDVEVFYDTLNFFYDEAYEQNGENPLEECLQFGKELVRLGQKI